MITLQGEGPTSKVRVEESRSRLRVAIMLDLEESTKLVGSMQEILISSKSVQGKSTFRGKRRSFLVEKGSNGNGGFIKMSELGPRRFPLALFVPEGRNKEGWLLFLDKLCDVLKTVPDYGKLGRHQSMLVSGVLSVAQKPSYADVVKMGWREEEGSRVERWKRAVVCVAQGVTDWSGLSFVEGILRKGLFVSLQEVDGCFLRQVRRIGRGVAEERLSACEERGEDFPQEVVAD